MDFYQEQHSYTLARNVNANSDDESDEESSWVMMGRDGDIVKLPGENIFYKVRSRIALNVATPKAVSATLPFTIKSDSGTVYITNKRVIYIPVYPTTAFQSFSAPILDFEDTCVRSSFFGPWSWVALVKPTAGGNIPANVPVLELKLTFREGGHDAFANKFATMRERLCYARTLQQETGQIIPTDEELPRYEPPPTAGPSTASSSQAPAPAPAPAPGSGSGSASVDPASGDNNAKETDTLEYYARLRQQQTPRGAEALDATLVSQTDASTPSEPPPDYEQVQAQALGIRLEETMREAANR